MMHSPENLQERVTCAIDKSCCGEAELTSSCTLDPAKMPLRVERWRSLFAQVSGYTTGPTLAEFCFNDTDQMRNELTELVKLERVCCAHISWELSQSGDQIKLSLHAEKGTLPNLLSLLIPTQSVGEVQ